MGIKPWPTLTLHMEGGPDDGLVVVVSAGESPEPPEELLSVVDPMGGRYLRHPERHGQWEWVYHWVTSSVEAD